MEDAKKIERDNRRLARNWEAKPGELLHLDCSESDTSLKRSADRRKGIMLLAETIRGKSFHNYSI